MPIIALCNDVQTQISHILAIKSVLALGNHKLLHKHPCHYHPVCNITFFLHYIFNTITLNVLEQDRQLIHIYYY